MTGLPDGDDADVVTDGAGVEPAFRADRRPLIATIALSAIVAIAAGLAIALHRNGHTQGDDFALYLRQARSIFDGDISQVVADNRFSVINSGPAFSPIAYPWGWPLLLAPFVHVWGLDYERLKLVEVAAFCVWLILVHGIIRRRAGRLLALAVVAVIGTAPILLAHTDQLLSEYPHAAAVAVFIWWMDRIKARHPLIAASPRSLVLLGVLAAAAYNIRREAVVLAAVILVVQVAELVAAYRRGPPIPVPWKTVATPHVAFIGAVIGFQLLIPSMLMPDNGDSPSFIRERMGDYASVLTQQLGLGSHPALGTVILLLAGAGMVIGCIRRPRLDIALTAVTVLTAMTVSTHFRMVGRYYFQIMPWVLYFATAAIVAAVQWALLSWTRWGAEGRARGGAEGRARDGAERRARRGATGRARTVAASVAALPLLYVVAVHAFALPDDVSAARDFDRSGRQQVGPTDPAITPIFEAVEQHTDPTSVIAYYRARTMTLLTDRRSIQTTDIDRVMQSADYYAQMRYSDYSQPDITPNEAAALGLVEVWSDARWILWRVPDPALVPKSG